MQWESHWLAVKFVFRRGECLNAKRAEKFLYLIPMTYFRVVAIDNKKQITSKVLCWRTPSQTCSGAVPFAAAVALILNCAQIRNQVVADSLTCSLGTCLGNVSSAWFYLLAFVKWWFQALAGVWVWYSPSMCIGCTMAARKTRSGALPRTSFIQCRSGEAVW